MYIRCSYPHSSSCLSTSSLPFSFPSIYHATWLFLTLIFCLAAFAGIVLCLVFNVVAISVNWIRGGGNYFTLSVFVCNGLPLLKLQQMDLLTVFTNCRSQNLFPCYNICHTWNPSFICAMVQASISCYEVRLNNLYISSKWVG